MPQTPFALFTARLRRNWRALHTGLWFKRSRYRRMDRLYLLEDPWQLASAREHGRFALTNAVIAEIAPDCAALLEIGSGEGEQTAHLLKVARSVTGIEVSQAAVDRARLAVSHAEFLVGCAEDAPALLGGRRFDIVTACEMLYYAPDVRQVLDTLKRLAPRVLVTVYDKRAQGFASHFEGAGWSRLEDMVIEGTRWYCHVWRAPEPAPA
jgi:2-polyprenyl-3-methyl-5-hydroxy-6-metoxy-1,4-benzoquinol methylase